MGRAARHELAHRLHSTFADELFHALDPAAIGSHTHAVGLEDHRVLAFLFEMEHDFAGARRSIGGALDTGENVFCCAIKVDANAHSAGETHLNLFERLD